MRLCLLVDEPDAAEVAAAVERRVQPGVEDAVELRLEDETLAEGEHVRIVVRPTHPRRLEVPGDRAADAREPVGDDRLAVPRSAEHDAAVAGPLRDRLGDGADEDRIVDRRLRVRAAVDYLVPARSQRGLEDLLVAEPG